MSTVDGTYTGGGSNNSPGFGGHPISGSGGEVVKAGHSYTNHILAGSDVYVTSSHAAAFNVDSGVRADFSASPDVPLVIKSAGGSTLVGNGGRDTIRSTAGNDTIYAGGHSKVIAGTAGDTIYGGRVHAAHDTINAGTGGDKITVYQGSNTINGNANDTITAGRGHDTVYGGAGPETIHGGLHTTIYGGGADKVYAGNQDTISLSGHDTLFAGFGTNTVSTTDGSHALIAGNEGGNLTVNLAKSATANDTLFGGSGGAGSVTLHVDYSSKQYTVDKNPDADGRTVIHFSGGQTIHVSNVTIDFSNGTHKTF